MDLSVACYQYTGRPYFQVAPFLGPLLYTGPTEYLRTYYELYDGEFK